MDSDDSEASTEAASKRQKPKHRQQFYRQRWENQFNGWLKPDPTSKTRARCEVCNKTFISELSAIRRHGMSSCHANNVLEMAAKKEWSTEETTELIAFYEENPVLWNPKCEDYRNHKNKEKIFKEISEKFNCTADEVQRKLHNLRHQISQELKKMKDSKSDYVSNWPHFESLKFLVPVLIENKRKASSKSTIKEAEAQSDRKVLKKAMKVFLKEPNDDDHFGQYVAMELKGLRSEYNKKRLKTEIRKAIVRIVEEDDNLYAETSSVPVPASSLSAVVFPVNILNSQDDEHIS